MYNDERRRVGTRKRTRGAWGKGKTLDEIDAEIQTMRSMYGSSFY